MGDADTRTRTALHLAGALSELRLAGLEQRGATRLLTRAVVSWAEGLGWLPVTEMPFEFLAGTPEHPERMGYVDVYVARAGYRRDVVIEIDSTNKAWSAQKLGHAARHGKAAIWIRWRGAAPRDELVPAGVEVIYLGQSLRPTAVAAMGMVDAVDTAAGHGRSGATRVLLAAPYPSGVPDDDPVWKSEEATWERVDGLDRRIALILRCRFGARGRALTLVNTADVVAEELAVPLVSRERIRQLQVKGLRQLRGRSRAHVRRQAKAAAIAAATSADASVASTPSHLPLGPAMPQPTPEAEALPLDEVFELVVDVLNAVGGRLPPTQLAHLLHGSPGPMTRRIVLEHRAPHHGALRDLPWGAVRRHVSALEAAGKIRRAGHDVEIADDALAPHPASWPLGD